MRVMMFMLVVTILERLFARIQLSCLPLDLPMTYQLACACGLTLEVGPQQAGDRVSCRCGKQLQVPRLSQLRALSGQGGFETNAIDKINRLKQQGELPRGTFCLKCDRRVDQVSELLIQCERPWVKEARSNNYAIGFLSAFLTAVIPMLFDFLRKLPAEQEDREFGHERSVILPVLLCAEHAESLLNSSNQRALRQLLFTMPEYAELFAEFPEATIVVH